VGDLEALETVARLGLLADDVEDGVDELRTFGVVALRPIVTGARLSEDEVVGAEDLAERAGADCRWCCVFVYFDWGERFVRVECREQCRESVLENTT
jgi:hypothetical protein